LMETSRLER